MNDPIMMYPQPSIPNPLGTTPYMQMSDDQIAQGVEAAGYRIDAAEHTRQALIRERDRRAALRAAGGAR
ncbi:hypothetical protein [Microbacterium paraoxydans]|jgi:hypothetical protein|uniref:Uncharacterized protein n=1 Tax=Microbacterium paraoxydans TaxID=199592 RepID=A0A1H1LBR5_9MICO|nr:hypothetical protein [Microbacterium paraoxydans]SDR71867.1 hypothetical protein SAMN04489809_0064 [Microbacterium paraoxydans]